MKSIFKKARKKFIASNKISKYLLYAVGEIVLIVIGILIAVGINNISENSAASKREEFYLAGLKTEFKQNKAKLAILMDVNMQNYEMAKKLVNYMHSDSIPGEEELATLMYKSFANETYFNPTNSMLRELLNSGNLKDINNSELRMHLTAWESHVLSVQRQEETLSQERQNTIKAFRNANGSIRTVLDLTSISENALLIPTLQEHDSNAAVLSSREFENALLLFILTGITTSAEHYLPLSEEIDAILKLLEEES